MLSKLRYLSEIDIFQDLTPQDMDWMDSVTTMTTCEKGRVFYTPDETGEVLFLLKKGRVQLYRISPEGKKLVIATLGPGSIFGEMSMVGQGMHNTFAEAVDECTLCVMSRADLERVLVSKPQVGLRIVETLGQRLREAEARLEDIAFKNIPARLASLLLRLYEEHGETIEGYTHQDLAEMIGTYRETTTQTLNDFKRDGLLDIGRKRLVLYDLEGLRAIAEQ
ncbi:MAG: Crp/Fnr family transcriptional regulator [Chloroflexi bacterium]|nr:MAG: Crp/Fnr family transcriptional regulator [Chloroflexota bacterium]